MKVSQEQILERSTSMDGCSFDFDMFIHPQLILPNKATPIFAIVSKSRNEHIPHLPSQTEGYRSQFMFPSVVSLIVT
jgi:hypothetical protein